jgi:hypothetical protein
MYFKGVNHVGCVCKWNGIWKWNDTVADLNDMREKSKNVLYKKSEKFCFVVIFYLFKSDKN